MKRREFLTVVGIGSMSPPSRSFARIPAPRTNGPSGSGGSRDTNAADPTSLRMFLESAAVSHETVNRFLENKGWARFDSELGYVHNDSVHPGGLDGAICFSTYASTGERTMIQYNRIPCRINTYGNSFTNCAQVSDGETWQEYLAGHIGEPVRNLGVGGTGVYQAYRRMLRKESQQDGAEYLMFDIYDDDHFRNLHKCRWFVLEDYRKDFAKKAKEDLPAGYHKSPWFHGNPWPYLSIDPKTGAVEEHDNPYSTPESLYRLCDPEHVYEAFKDDLPVQVMVAGKSGRFEFPEKIRQLCRTLEIAGDLQNPNDCRRMARELYLKCAIKASMYTLEKASEFAAAQNKKLMILLSYSGGRVLRALRGEHRFDSAFVDFLARRKFQFVDTLETHLEDFKSFRLSPEQYIRRYYIGHYSPRGNQFFSFAIKNAVVKWLNPKPPAYSRQ